MKSIVEQHENPAAKGMFGVRVPLQFFISFRLSKNNTRHFLQINSSINSKDFYTKFVVTIPSESILIFGWIITNFEKLACFEQFVWAWCNIFASFFCCGCYVQNLLRLFCRISSFYTFLRLFNFTREPRIHW